MLAKVLDFLFGRDAKVFNKKGEVEIDRGAKVWEAWQNQRRSDPALNWRNHTGIRGKVGKKN